MKHDFGVLEGTDDWSVIQLDLRKYFYLGTSDKIRQSVPALDYWTSYTSGWNPSVDSLGPYIDGRPPNSLGSTLGGFNRLRTYSVDRSSDKTAIYYSAELRLMPKWNPLGNMKILKPLNIDWWQIVLFVEIDRVAPQWSFSELHTDMRKVKNVGPGRTTAYFPVGCQRLALLIKNRSIRFFRTFDLPILFSKLFLVTVLNRGLSLINPFADLGMCGYVLALT